jgi:hypothetical protein
VLDSPQLSGRRLVAAVRFLRVGIELLQPRQHALCLRALHADLVGVRTRCGGPEQGRHEQAD